MPDVLELSDPYANFMLGPRRGRDVCSVCFNLTDGFDRCYACTHSGHWLDAMLPISYSVCGEQLHHALAGYKRLTGRPAQRLTIGLAAVLWRHLALHEECLAGAAGVAGFDLVTTVPSTHSQRGDGGPLHALVAGLVRPVRHRCQRLLRCSAEASVAHHFNARRYEALQAVDGRAVLLIDDTWTTGANARSAAAALRAAGAARVAALVIGRYVSRDWRRNDAHLRALPQPFDWAQCALCARAGQARDEAAA